MSDPGSEPQAEERFQLPSHIEYEKRREGVRSLELTCEKSRTDLGRQKLVMTIKGDKETIETLIVGGLVKMGDCVLLAVSNYNIEKMNIKWAGRVKPIKPPEGQATLSSYVVGAKPTS